MKKRLDPELIDEENPELDDAWFERARPVAQVLPPELLAVLSQSSQENSGLSRKPLKVPATIRFDADVLAGMKATGKGWQSRINALVRDWLQSHPSA